MADDPNFAQADSPETQRYNRIRRWLGIADFLVGLVFLIVLLVTRWSDWLRDLAYRAGFQNYSLSLFMYLLLLLVISKVLGIGLDYYGFALERRFKLVDADDFSRGFGMSSRVSWLVWCLGTVVVELLYFTLRQWPQHWWVLAWALFMGLFIIARTTGAGCSVSDFLQVRAPGQRRSATTPGRAERARRHDGCAACIGGSFRKRARRRMPR